MLKFLQAAAAALVLAAPASAARVYFSFAPDYAAGRVSDDFTTVKGYIDNAVEGDNVDFALSATLTQAADPAVLGSGYLLTQLVGGEPALRIVNGRVVAAAAAFGRYEGDPDNFTSTLTLSTDAAYYITGIIRTNGADFSDQEQTGNAITFGALGGGTVPEPEGWALLLTGFGGAGVAMRRRRLGLASA